MTTSSLTSVPELDPIYLRCTPVEIDILGHLLVDGPSNLTIARKIRRAEDTVKTHMRRILARSGMPNRVALVIGILRDDIYVLDTDGRRVRF